MKITFVACKIYTCNTICEHYGEMNYAARSLFLLLLCGAVVAVVVGVGGGAVADDCEDGDDE